ncbi:MAG: hypothetical protein JNM10_18885 [Planctomycetia bacterium]|nr:hypothetical protein [Planctomycetia bacterium]
MSGDDDQRTAARRFGRAARSLQRAMEEAIRLDHASVWKYAGFGAYVKQYNSLANAAVVEARLSAPIFVFDESKVPSPTNTIAIVQKSIFENVYANLAILAACLEDEGGMRDDAILGLKDFLVANVRRAMHDAPKAEVHVQDAVETLLIGRGYAKGQDYDREAGRVRSSGKDSIPDFIMPRLGVALEVKLVDDVRRARAVVDEINADIRAYGKSYQLLIFLVYDIGSIRDEAEFRRDFESQEGVHVLVVKH